MLHAANKAPNIPDKYGIISILNVGFIINKAPVNATIIDIICFLFIFSFKNNAHKITDKMDLIYLTYLHLIKLIYL